MLSSAVQTTLIPDDSHRAENCCLHWVYELKLWSLFHLWPHHTDVFHLSIYCQTQNTCCGSEITHNPPSSGSKYLAHPSERLVGIVTSWGWEVLSHFQREKWSDRVQAAPHFLCYARVQSLKRGLGCTIQIWNEKVQGNNQINHVISVTRPMWIEPGLHIS